MNRISLKTIISITLILSATLFINHTSKANVLIHKELDTCKISAFEKNSNRPNYNESNCGTRLLQCASAGQILGFSNEGLICVSKWSVLKISFINANKVCPESINYDTNNYNNQNIKPTNQIIYKNLWDGISANYITDGSNLLKTIYEIDLSKKEVDINSIKLVFSQSVMIDKTRNLILNNESGSMVKSRPMAWQKTSNGIKYIEVSFIANENNEIGFQVGQYEAGLPLIIEF